MAFENELRTFTTDRITTAMGGIIDPGTLITLIQAGLEYAEKKDILIKQHKTFTGYQES